MQLQDEYYQMPQIIAPDIFIIGIDEASLQNRNIIENEDGSLDYQDGGLGPFQSWTRTDFANLINKLNENADRKPAGIGVDTLFSGNRTEEEDLALVEAVRNGGNVVLASQATFGTELSDAKDGLVSAIRTYEAPYEELLAVADVGHITTVPDADGIIRHSIYQIPYEGEMIKSFGVQIVENYNAYWGVEYLNTIPPLDENNQWYITYSGQSGDYFGSSADGISVIRVLNGEIDTALFAGSIVLIGPYSFGMMDSYYTPMSSEIQMHGVEIHANIIQALLESNYKEEISQTMGILIIITLGFLCFFVAVFVDMRISFFVISGMIVWYVMTAKIAFEHGYRATLLYPTLCMASVYIFQVAIQYFMEKREKQKIKGIFKKYIDPKLVDNLLLSRDENLDEVGQMKDIAVLFVDIRGFTPLSEKFKDNPEIIVQILNEFYLPLFNTYKQTP